MKTSVKIALLAILLGAVSSVARADLYETAYFSAELIPVTGSLSEIGMSTDMISGNFVFDEQLIPGPDSGIQSVAFNSMPAISEIPPSTAFQMTMGENTFNRVNFLPGTGGIVYNNGQFDGFDVAFDFFYNGQEYRFVEQGTGFEIQLLAGNAAIIIVAGTIDFNPLFNIQPYVPSSSASSGLGLNTGGIGTGDGNTAGDSNGSDPFSDNSPPDNNSSPTITINTPGNNNPSPVPEPGMFGMLAAATISLGARVVIERRRSLPAR